MTRRELYPPIEPYESSQRPKIASAVPKNATTRTVVSNPARSQSRSAVVSPRARSSSSVGRLGGYRANAAGGWTALRRSAGLLPEEASEEEAYVGRRFADLASHLLDAVGAFHERGILLGDLSPSNVLVDPGVEARVTARVRRAPWRSVVAALPS